MLHAYAAVPQRAARTADPHRARVPAVGRCVRKRLGQARNQVAALQAAPPDDYPDRRAAVYWEKLRYPFRWTDILSTLDAITQVGIGREDQQARAAFEWLAQRQ